MTRPPPQPQGERPGSIASGWVRPTTRSDFAAWFPKPDGMSYAALDASIAPLMDSDRFTLVSVGWCSVRLPSSVSGAPRPLRCHGPSTQCAYGFTASGRLSSRSSPVVKKDLPVKRFATRETSDLLAAASSRDARRGIWLEMAKKGSGVASVSHAEALEVAAAVAGGSMGRRLRSTPRGTAAVYSRARREANGRESTARPSSGFIARVS